MSEAEKPAIPGSLPEAVVDEWGKQFPVIWLLPLIALLIGGWLVVKAIIEQGPEVVIQFQTAEGIEEGKTLVKYRDVIVGKVKTVRFAEDLTHVLVKAEMVPGMERHLIESTRFWVVRPRVDSGEISGLGTLISGAYVAMDPGKEGDESREFVGLETPPVIKSNERGTVYHLRAEKASSLSVGAPVYYRQIAVGQVTGYRLAKDHAFVDVDVFVEAPHDFYVRRGSRFWNVGGVDVSIDPAGVTVELESFASLISGGIAFETPLSLTDSEQAPEDTVFRLYPNYARTREKPVSRGYRYRVDLSGDIRGLLVSAPVELMGVRVGTVMQIDPYLDLETKQARRTVFIELEAEKMLRIEERADLEGEQLEKAVGSRVEVLLARGLRARLETTNLLTGQKIIALDLMADAKPVKLVSRDGYPVIPAAPGEMEQLGEALTRTLAKLEKLPLDRMVRNADQMMISLDKLAQAASKALPSLVDETHEALDATDEAMRGIDALVAEEGALGTEFYAAVRELQLAARAVRLMAEYLERHPESLLKGKDESP
ncbi:paraquat-inducible protein B [Thiogranum longum]|uniref:Paraquat-inducible protein B n=1 Tax=Thiogranum longum TaxID=1537524 RepID=A0A4R1HAJ8_9GAMM|nr:MlaD family protein [Thiogranum longum]TCK18964.1 paraquat-inducible protein B [Thiogranum longum]